MGFLIKDQIKSVKMNLEFITTLRDRGLGRIAGRKVFEVATRMANR